VIELEKQKLGSFATAVDSFVSVLFYLIKSGNTSMGIDGILSQINHMKTQVKRQRTNPEPAKGWNRHSRG
jgi:hypothetical protein